MIWGKAFMGALIGTLIILAIGVFGVIRQPLADVPPQPASSPVVLVETDSGAGTGFHVGDGLFVTAAHVVQGGMDSVSIKAVNGDAIKAVVVAFDMRADVAILQVVRFETFLAYALNCAASLHVGDEVRAVGNPFRVEGITAFGRVSRLPTETDKRIKLNILGLPGMSGGPVLTADHRVVAIVVSVMAVRGTPVALTNGVPASEACRLIGAGYVGA